MDEREKEIVRALLAALPTCSGTTVDRSSPRLYAHPTPAVHTPCAAPATHRGVHGDEQLYCDEHAPGYQDGTMHAFEACRELPYAPALRAALLVTGG